MHNKRLLQIVVAVELVVCGFLIVQRLSRPALPPFNASIVDPLTASDLRGLARSFSPDDMEDFVQLGEAYLVHGSYRQAEACYRHAATELGARTEIELGRGIALERLGRTSEAIDVFRRIVQNAGSELRAEVWYRIGRNLLREEKPDEADEAFREVLEFIPAKFQVAKLLIRTGRAEEARPLIEELLRVGPDVMEINQLAGDLSRSLGDDDRARYFRDRIERDPQRLTVGRTVAFYRQVRRKFGSAKRLVEATEQEKQQRLDEAEAMFAEVLEHDFSEPLAVKLASLNLRMNRSQRALDICEQGIANAGPSAGLLEQRGAAQMALGQADDALQSWQRSVEIAVHPSNALRLADEYRRRDNDTLATRYEALARFARGLALYRVDKIDQAAVEMDASHKLLPEYAPTNYYLGEIARLRGRLEEAESYYNKCLELDPGHGRAFAALSRLQL